MGHWDGQHHECSRVNKRTSNTELLIRLEEMNSVDKELQNTHALSLEPGRGQINTLFADRLLDGSDLADGKTAMRWDYKHLSFIATLLLLLSLRTHIQHGEKRSSKRYFVVVKRFSCRSRVCFTRTTLLTHKHSAIFTSH